MDRDRKSPFPAMHRKHEAGFTLVEVMIAMLIFGIGLSALAQAIPRGMQTRARSEQLTVATSLAQEGLEQLRDLRFNDALLAAGAHSDAANPLDQTFSRRWTVQDDTPVAGMKQVTMTVSFPTDSPDSQAVFTTFIQP